MSKVYSVEVWVGGNLALQTFNIQFIHKENVIENKIVDNGKIKKYI